MSRSPKKDKATKPAFNVGPSSVCQRNAIKMAFRWRADEGPLVLVFGFSLPSSTKKIIIKKGLSRFLDGLPLTKPSGSAHVLFL